MAVGTSAARAATETTNTPTSTFQAAPSVLETARAFFQSSSTQIKDQAPSVGCTHSIGVSRFQGRTSAAE